MIWLNLLLIASAFGGDMKCGHTPDFDSELQFTSDSPGRSLAQSSLRDNELKPIRLQLHYLEMNMSIKLESEFKNDLMKTVKEFYQNRLLVYPLKDNLKLTGFTKCASITIPEQHKTTGVEADLLIYVFGKSYTDETWVARAGACILEGAPYRNVLTGRIEVNTARYTDSITYEDRMQTVIHEIFHILGFSNSLYQYYRKENGTAFTSSELTSSTTIRGKTVTLFKSPTVLSKARAAFGCSTLPGLELEDGGGSGTAGSHWEKRMMFNDFMIGDIGPTDILYSDITFSLLKDSGWYDINWDYTDSILYGKGRGCDFYENKCIMNDNPQFPEFCVDDSDVSKCDYLKLYKGYCNKKTLSSTLPEYTRYFSKTNVGGSDSFMDYCPIVKGYSNGSCRGIGVATTLLDTGSGEAVSVSSRCFEHNLLDTGYSYTSSFQKTRAGCYSVRCSGNKYYVTVGNTEIQCIPNKRITYDGYNGKLSCPGYDEACGPVPCPLGCRGVGKCDNGFCNCDAGYGGDDCSIQCHSSCKNCEGKSYNQCSSCYQGYNLSNGQCDSKTITCPSLCSSCTSSTSCTACKANTYKNASGKCLCGIGYTESNGECISIQCPSLCSSCTSTSLCQTCVGNAVLSSNGVCVCKAGYTLEDQKCKAVCSNKCKSCSKSDGSNCLSCYENSSLVDGDCVCDYGYEMRLGVCAAKTSSETSDCPAGCATCRFKSFCDSCKDGYLLWKSVQLCYLQCPSQYDIKNTECEKSDNLETINLQLYNNYLSGSPNSVSMEYLSFDPNIPSYAQGVYFTGDSYTRITTPVIFATDFYIEIVFRPDMITSSQSLFSKYSGESVLDIGIDEAFNLYLQLRVYNTTSTTVSLEKLVSSTISSLEWHKIGVVVDYDGLHTHVSIYDKSQLISEHNLDDSFFLDVMEVESAYLYLGARYNGVEFTQMYKGFVAGIVSKNTAEYSSTARRLRGFESQMLPNCNIGEVYEEGVCKHCQKECKAGCFRSTDCRLHHDPLCRVFTNWKECTECVEFSEIIDGKCRCEEGTYYDKTQQICKELISY